MPTAGVEIASWFAVLTGVAVVCISTVSPAELVVAASAALGGAFAVRRMRLAAGVRWGGGRGGLRAARSVPPAVLGGIASLLVALVHRPDSRRLRRLTLREGTDAGWAAAAVAASPDTCVVDIPRDDEVLVHSLRARAGSVERIVSRGEGAAL
ncbi:hypothetical protein [Streptomyces sp. NPDC058964]|uniref:hypothetical protein n=1 Tax=Streptomyces sp. NPDC058964 TaxID=3346681 RepID=UPI0036D0EB0A